MLNFEPPPSQRKRKEKEDNDDDPEGVCCFTDSLSVAKFWFPDDNSRNKLCIRTKVGGTIDL